MVNPMKLIFDPIPSLSLLSLEPEVVIGFEDNRPAEVYVREGLPRPDRHLLLGIVQSILVAVEEMDPESVELMTTCTIKLDRGNEVKELRPGLIIVRVKDGRFGALIVGDRRSALRLARQAVRWFTGTIRLDIP
jgi:hypothetical protein